MNKLFLLAVLVLSFLITNAQYNNDTAGDLVLVKSNHCYMYESPQTIYRGVADSTLLKLPMGLPLKTIGYRNNYYKIDINGEVGYIFCLHVTTPKRIKEIRCHILLPEATKQAYAILDEEQKTNTRIHRDLDELDTAIQIWMILAR